MKHRRRRPGSRALNAEALKATHAEIRAQHDHDSDAAGRLAAENSALKQRFRDLAASNGTLEERLQAARSNNRFLDRRIADLEARLLNAEADT